MRHVWLVALFLIAATSGSHEGYFAPAHRLTGIGAERFEMSNELLAARTRLMIESQTFGILRDPRAAAGAERILNPNLQKIFAQAERLSGWPAELLSAIAYLESFGDPLAQSPTGPRGIMQVSGATAQAMGLRVIYATRYRVTTETVQSKAKNGKPVSKTVKHKTPYNVFVRDERLVPERAIPAAAHYLARLENSLGGRDWAIFAYHCGPGCVRRMQDITEAAQGMKKPISVAKMFFAASPALNRDLYLEIKHQMDRDFSPTYWFRVLRAMQLLAMYKEDRHGFLELVEQYKFAQDPTQRAHDRLACWLRPKDLVYQSDDDLKREQGKSLVKAFDNPDFYGFVVRRSASSQDYYMQASPAAVGTLTYIAFETRRLFDAMKPKDQKFVPLEVATLVRPLDPNLRLVTSLDAIQSTAHSSGHVFDIDAANLPPAEAEALQFVLEDMGWEGYLGFVQESPNSGVMHIGCSPSSREFFAKVFQDATDAKK